MRLLDDPTVCELFLEKLESMRRRFSFRLYGYVLMPTHVHLLLSEPDHGTLADVVHSLKLSVSKTAHRRCPTFAQLTWGIPSSEHTRLWQARYYDRNVRDYEEFREKLRYIHRNPVNRGLCARPEDWPWSSFIHYATGTTGAVEIESEWTARRRETLALSGKTHVSCANVGHRQDVLFSNLATRHIPRRTRSVLHSVARRLTFVTFVGQP